MMLFLLHLFGLPIGFKTGAIAAIIFSVENEAAFQVCAGNSRDK
jgi:hypothetical protein